MLSLIDEFETLHQSEKVLLILYKVPIVLITFFQVEPLTSDENILYDTKQKNSFKLASQFDFLTNS